MSQLLLSVSENEHIYSLDYKDIAIQEIKTAIPRQGIEEF
jgi:hypothetical protein